MSEIFGFDTETTGLPDWQSPSGDECQPHLVQLAAGVFDEETHELKQSIDVIVRPEGWVIPDEVSEIHGITTEMAMDVGVPEAVALDIFLCLWNQRKRIAFNTTFDNRIIRIATKRYETEDVQAMWKEGDYECSMLAARKVMSGKNPKLSAAYKYFTDNDLKNAHSAMPDMMACMEIYWATR